MVRMDKNEPNEGLNRYGGLNSTVWGATPIHVPFTHQDFSDHNDAACSSSSYLDPRQLLHGVGSH